MRRLPVMMVILIVLLALGVQPGEAAPPSAATLVQPTGVIGGSSFTFTWQAVAGATFYYLQVNDATASPRLTLWYPAGMACPGGSATCTATVTAGWAAGPAIWWVQTWNPDGFGPWSAGMRFTVTFTPGAWGTTPVSERFQLVLGGAAVLDKLTGLVWERTPSTNAGNWNSAVLVCLVGSTGGILGWRLPAIEELSSLVDRTRTNPALPADHPFSILNTSYWSATTSPSDSSAALSMGFGTGAFAIGAKTNASPSWCVRGGQAAQNPY